MNEILNKNKEIKKLSDDELIKEIKFYDVRTRFYKKSYECEMSNRFPIKEVLKNKSYGKLTEYIINCLKLIFNDIDKKIYNDERYKEFPNEELKNKIVNNKNNKLELTDDEYDELYKFLTELSCYQKEKIIKYIDWFNEDDFYLFKLNLELSKRNEDNGI